MERCVNEMESGGGIDSHEAGLPAEITPFV